ncbi:MAG: hypothetical protein ACJA0N_001190, partial [Pseudohongiellaceae bacterium]
MFCNKLFGIFLTMIIFSVSAFAVTDANIWLPKRYTDGKNKLLSTAVEAERTDRCISAILGEINVEKTSADTYYFVITCRDKNQVSYNLSYTYPVNGAMPTLVKEQLVIEQEEEASAITADVAWSLCINEIKQKKRTMLGVTISGEAPSQSDERLEIQTFEIPFDAKSPDDILLRYKTNCTVDIGKNVTIGQLIIVQQEDEVGGEEVPAIAADVAWSLCIDEIKQKTRTMFEIVLAEENPNPSDEKREIQTFEIPFDAKSPDDILLR